MNAAQNRDFHIHAMRGRVKPCTRSIRLFELLLLIPACLITVGAAGEQLDHHDSISGGLWYTLNLAGDFRTTGYAPGSRDATGTEPVTTFSLPVEADQAYELSLQKLLDNAETALERFREFRRESDLFLGLDADMDDRVVYRSGVLVHKITMLIRELRDAPGSVQEEALSKQSADVRAAGLRLFLMTRRVELLMEEQGRCGLCKLGVLLSAIETLALELDDSVADQKPAASHLEYFFFPNHLPDVVPEGGGWLIMVGSGLGQDSATTVTVVDRDSGKQTAPLETRRTGVEKTIAVRIKPEWIAENAGRCLFLTVNNKTQGTHRQQAAKSGDGESLPLCIPLSFDTTYKIAGFLEYRTPTQTRLHKSRSILFENPSCTEGKRVSESLEWELNPGGWLTDMGESVLYEAGATSIDCGISENRIVCQGYLGPAVCSQEQRSGDNSEQKPSLLEQSEWEHIFTPVEEYPEEKTHHSWALSELAALKQQPVQIELEVPREKPSEETTMWYELIVVNGGQERTLFVSPKKTLNNSEQNSYMVGGNQIAEEFTPEQDAGAAKIKLSIEPPACRY